ncbi:mitochondrial import protein Pam17 [Wallemia mellicola CBS 633.66]|uniref:Presequence translocated-associated motor subunit PAM17 n=1 Tax=Wallemia mellicola (strain ATCC MYA-4683 / CBS 633.66) TaxID=671144 RepID=I4Y8X0_WALMC|nr:mitochondrial import protein Pam17 [Wallemia mellicola CBS 633.66]EIM20412.1 mitochondrial import protein Pam17 [Wallemia mellicola CBS 633.66]|eukprot:XP_006959438.1 mitochondrial import protein Pam17 [Wallemia mellicola CBS 633.66]
MTYTNEIIDRYDNIASIPTTLTGFFGGASYFSTLDPGQIIFGIEAVWVYSFASVSCGALGWLTGPTLGTAVWKFLHKAKLPEYEIKERVFYHHIMKNRVDPARQSVQNPVPDYYGENVYSLQTYRQWLRDQATYNRKAYLSENE